MSDNVVNIGEMRLKHRRESRYIGPGECSHLRVTLDDHGEIVSCDDCGVKVTPYWALKALTLHWMDAKRRFDGQRRLHQEEVAASLHLLAAKKVERVWRTKDMVPACPHCHKGILPSDGLGDTTFSKRIEENRRQAEKSKETPT